MTNETDVCSPTSLFFSYDRVRPERQQMSSSPHISARIIKVSSLNLLDFVTRLFVYVPQ